MLIAPELDITARDIIPGVKLDTSLLSTTSNRRLSMSPSVTPSEGAREGDTIHPEGPQAVAEPRNEKPEEAIGLQVGSDSDNTNRLVGAINEQSAILKTVLESVTKAVEALKQQPQSPDKKIAFWTAYKKLADEFDNELQAKYGQDLDTSLIFVCAQLLRPELLFDLYPGWSFFSR
ncbi:hypothetical protein MVEN_02204900 [Mycena venus]|uniref:Uncharacterized protein n=1 Tax=Mycena venus TaxID=2733690 RepID=A0A8H6X7H7_9AGAR|nr:hypothetical protein MVEN_02204900 [Mycena venus]